MGLMNILFGNNKKAEYLKELYTKGALIIDVRNPNEFVAGHIKDSTNIPLPNIGKSIASLKQKNKPIIAVCQSGGRSGMAVTILKNNGIDAYNGGPWNVLKNEMQIQ